MLRKEEFTLVGKVLPASDLKISVWIFYFLFLMSD